MLVRVLTKLFGPIRLNESIYTTETEATLFSVSRNNDSSVNFMSLKKMFIKFQFPPGF